MKDKWMETLKQLEDQNQAEADRNRELRHTNDDL